jgi:hypothetical protein
MTRFEHLRHRLAGDYITGIQAMGGITVSVYSSAVKRIEREVKRTRKELTGSRCWDRGRIRIEVAGTKLTAELRAEAPEQNAMVAISGGMHGR